jgi:hypothetical protein
MRSDDDSTALSHEFLGRRRYVQGASSLKNRDQLKWQHVLNAVCAVFVETSVDSAGAGAAAVLVAVWSHASVMVSKQIS